MEGANKTYVCIVITSSTGKRYLNLPYICFIQITER